MEQTYLCSHGYSAGNGYKRLLTVLQTDTSLWDLVMAQAMAAFYGGGSWNDVGTNAPGSLLATATIIGMTNDNTTATPYYNGTAMTTKNGNMGSGTTGFALGAINSNSGQSWDGPIAEIVVTNSVLSTTDRQKNWKDTLLINGD